MEIISNICAVLVVLAILAVPVLLIIFVIRWCMRKSKKWIGIAAAICAGCIVPLAFIGAFTDPATYCEHEYYLTDSKPATCTSKGFEMYHCDFCGRDTKKKLDKLGHDMVDVRRVEPTYDENGEYVRGCTRCEHEEITVLKKLQKPTAATDSTDMVETTENASFVTGTVIQGEVPEINNDGIQDKLVSFGFTEEEASDIRDILLKCGIADINNAEPTDKVATIDGLIAFRWKMDDKRTAWFTVDKREVIYIGLNGVDVYDRDKGGFLINVNDIHIPESYVSLNVRNTLIDRTESVLDAYFISAQWYDAWGVARSDDEYMVQCDVYAKNKLGIADWVRAKVWYEYDGSEYIVTAVVIDGQRYK